MNSRKFLIENPQKLLFIQSNNFFSCSGDRPVEWLLEDIPEQEMRKEQLQRYCMLLKQQSKLLRNRE